MLLNQWLDELEEEPTTFTIAVAAGLEVTLRIPRNADDLASLEKMADKFATTATKNPPAEWVRYAPKTAVSARIAYLFHQLCVEPQVNVIDALRLMQAKGLMVMSLVTEAYRRAGATIIEQEVSDIERAGESSDEIASNAPSGS